MGKSLISKGNHESLIRAILAMALGCAPACSDEIDPGELVQLDRQPTERFPLGSTFYLPAPAEGQWVLAEAPAGNANAVVAGTDGYARFTPVVAGAYAFEIPDTDHRAALTVVDEVPYEQLNYYPTTSMAMVEGELWVTNVFDPHVSRVDPGSGAVLGTIAVGPWPTSIAYAPDHGVVLVAHEAGDTVGFVDQAEGRLVDALWVGDEPAQIMLSPDGARAYVSLSTENAVVVVDVAARAVVDRIATNPDPGVMALSPDGTTLYVASYRSAVSSRQQYGNDPRNDMFDIAVIDTASGEITGYIADVGATIGGLALAGDRLYVATTRVVVEELTGQEGMTAFRHTVAAYETGRLTELAAVDLGRQPSSGGWAVRPFGLALAGGTLWVATEGSDLVVGLDPDSLAETARFPAEGRPRGVLAADDRLFVHGAQAYRVTLAGVDGTVTGSAQLSGDPRPAGVAEGQRLYTGTGDGFGVNHSCADCHVDGLTDGNLWRAGFASSVSRPMFWMEGTDPIGWEGDGEELYSYLYGSPRPTIGVNLTNEVHDAFYDYLAALVPPPPANGLTRRDGAQTEEAERGEALFRGKAACTGCHVGSLTTGGLLLPGGGTQDDHPIVVPSLVGAYRHTFWLVDGAARTLEEAVEAMLPLSGSTLDDGEIADVARYLGELTAREFFVLQSWPQAGEEHVSPAGPLRLALSHPVFDHPDNLARLELRDAGGAVVPATLEVDGRRITVTPQAPLEPGADYALHLAEGFEAFDQATLDAEAVVPFTVAESPGLRLEGDYVLRVEHPVLDPVAGAYDPSTTLPVERPISAVPTDWGAVLTHPVTEGYVAQYDVVVDGDVAHLPPFVIPIQGGSSLIFNRSFSTTLPLRDDDGDGVADGGEGTLMFRSPGLEATDVRWTIARPSDEPTGCSGQEGTNPVELMLGDGGEPTVDWDPSLEALGYFVTDADAMPPAGPGPVTGGEAYWALSTAAFPAGFAGPVAYGELPEGATDVSADSEAPEGGAALPAGSCVKVTVTFTDFTTTVLRYETPAG